MRRLLPLLCATALGCAGGKAPRKLVLLHNTVAGQLRSGDDVLDALQPGDTILSATAE